jgi:GntR family transcriptional regulator
MTTAPPLQITVLADDSAPPYEQVRQQLAALVRSGALAGGRRLPPVRQLAADLGLAKGTVARAYQQLEAAGLVVTRRGAGTRVTEHVKQLPAETIHQELQVHARHFVRGAVSLGADPAAIRRSVEQALAEA